MKKWGDTTSTLNYHAAQIGKRFDRFIYADKEKGGPKTAFFMAQICRNPPDLIA